MGLFTNNCEPAFLHRSFPLLSAEGVAHLGTRKVAVAGCGGVGAGLAITLARMGVKSFHLADPGKFDLPDVNRQWGATTKTLGQLKVDVYRQTLLDINPDVEVKTFPEGCTLHNLDAFLDSCHLLIDCIDISVCHELRWAVHSAARQRRLFSVVGPMMGFGCVAICSSPDGMSMEAWTDALEQTRLNKGFPGLLKKLYMPEHLEMVGQSVHGGRVPSVAVAPIIAVGLLATECIAYFLDGIIPGSRKPVVLPRMMFFDLFRMSYRILDARPLMAKKPTNGIKQ